MKLKMKLIEGGEIKIPQESILQFWAEKPDTTKIEYEDESGKTLTVEVAHPMYAITQGVAA